MLTRFDWSWAFLFNVPVAALAGAVGVVGVVGVLAESRSSARTRVDLVGVVLSAGGLALLTYGIISAGEVGWSARSALAEMLGGVLALGAFVQWERRIETPL